MSSIFTEISIVITIASAVALVMRIIKQPLIIGHILTGILIGPLLFNLVKSPDTIDVFANLGIALLLFIIGLGLNPSVIAEVGRVAFVTGLVQIGVSGYFGFTTAVVLGYSLTEAVFVAAALAFSSTIIILKLLSDKKEQTRLYAKLTIGILLLQDIIATAALLAVTARTNGNFSPIALLILVGKGLGISLPLFYVTKRVLPKFQSLIAGSQEFLFLFAIGWGFGIAAAFAALGFSIEIGALLAGISLSGLPYAQEIGSRLRPLRDFFIIVFFISLGSRLQIDNLSNSILPILIFSVIVLLIKPVITLLSLGFFGYTKRTSFNSAVALGQLSEFSLVLFLLGEKANIVSHELISVITFVALITIALSTYAIQYSDKLYHRFEPMLVLFERSKTKYEREQKQNADLVLFGYQRGGHEFLKVFEGLSKKFVVIDYDPEIIDTLERRKINHLYGDATDTEFLNEVSFEHSKLVVSTMTDHESNKFLAKFLEHVNTHLVFISHADTIAQAAELYELGASYVMMPHYIGSEKIGSFIKKNGLKKAEFKKFREKHLAYLQTHHS
jgi:Kef-type K+ transport system membrane component KefB